MGLSIMVACEEVVSAAMLPHRVPAQATAANPTGQKCWVSSLPHIQNFSSAAVMQVQLCKFTDIAAHKDSHQKCGGAPEGLTSGGATSCTQRRAVSSVVQHVYD